MYDRRDYNSRGGNNNYRGGRRGGHRGRGFHYNNLFSSPNRGPRRPGNRFNAETPHVDPRQQVLKQLLQMLTQVGTVPKSTEETPEHPTAVRAVPFAQAKNVKLLTDVVCGSNADVFLQHVDASLDAPQRYGPLATGLVHSVATFPLQTSVYTSLTLSIHQSAAAKIAVDGAFAQRTVQYASHMLGRDLDWILLDTASAHHLPISRSEGFAERPRTITRIRLLLRYFCQLTHAGVLQKDENRDVDIALAAMNGAPISLIGLLDALVQAALAATQKDMKSVAYTLAAMTLGCIPYLGDAVVPKGWIISHIMDPLEPLMVSSSTAYQSDYAPGLGKKAILLKDEQLDDMGGEEDDEEEENDEEDGGQVCDSLQDLFRSVKQVIKVEESVHGSSFALFTDAPWTAMTEVTSQPPQDGDNTTIMSAETSVALEFTGTPLLLDIFPACRSLTLLLGGSPLPSGSDVVFSKHDLTGLVFGRLPIFGPPSNVDDEEEEDDEGMDSAPTNERLNAYQKEFRMTDRYFIGECIRDILLSHEPTVSDKGVERGSIKNAAEQMWSLASMMKDEGAAKGIEFVIVENIVSLIAQCSQNASVFSIVYLSRVILELTKLEPHLMTPALALAVSNLFTDYMPALVPIARYNLSHWFAFHLIHTDYQWPAAYWKHWEPFVIYGWNNSRGSFVRTALEYMVDNVSNPGDIVKQCLPEGSVLGDYLLAKPDAQNPRPLESFVTSTTSRIMMDENPESVLEHLKSEELSESVTGVFDAAIPMSRDGWRTEVVLLALLSPANTEYVRLKTEIEVARSSRAENDMVDSEATDSFTQDVLSILSEKIKKYKVTLVGAMAADADLQGSSDIRRGEVFLLEVLEKELFHSRQLLIACLHVVVVESIASVESIFRWLLGKLQNDGNGHIVFRWWELATYFIQLGMIGILMEPETVTDMMDDSAVSPARKKVSSLLRFLDPLLSYAAGQVGTLLRSSSDISRKSKFGPEQVDLVEGFKFVVAQSEYLFLNLLRDHSDISEVELIDTWNESDVAGPKLASLLDSGGSAALESLKRCLDRM
jgi:MIF4G like